MCMYIYQYNKMVSLEYTYCIYTHCLYISYTHADTHGSKYICHLSIREYVWFDYTNPIRKEKLGRSQRGCSWKVLWVGLLSWLTSADYAKKSTTPLPYCTKKPTFSKNQKIFVGYCFFFLGLSSKKSDKKQLPGAFCEKTQFFLSNLMSWTCTLELALQLQKMSK